MKKIWWFVIGIATIIIGLLIWRFFALAPVRAYAGEVEKIMKDSIELPAFNMEELDGQIVIWENAETNADKLQKRLEKINVSDNSDIRTLFTNTDNYFVRVKAGYNEISNIALVKSVLEVSKIENISDPQIAKQEMLNVKSGLENLMNEKENADIAIGPEFNDIENKTEKAFETYLETLEKAYEDALLGKDISYINDFYVEFENTANEFIEQLKKSLQDTIKIRQELLEDINSLKTKYII